jgi:hypothetical protein
VCDDDRSLVSTPALKGFERGCPEVGSSAEIASSTIQQKKRKSVAMKSEWVEMEKLTENEHRLISQPTLAIASL